MANHKMSKSPKRRSQPRRSGLVAFFVAIGSLLTLGGCSKPVQESRASVAVSEAQSPESQKSSNAESADSKSLSLVVKKDVTDPAATEHFLQLLDGSPTQFESSLQQIGEHWHPGSTVMLVEVMRFLRNPARSKQINDLLRVKTRQQHVSRLDAWYKYIWSKPYAPHPSYTQFKSHLYARIDPRFAEYFDNEFAAKIRLDEIRWGGVRRDGIPPLKDPEVVNAAVANYLADTDIIFGVYLNGEARAYPKRVLAWHEMVKDHLGGQSINGVYCTLCGSMIVYDTRSNGQHYELGTSGFLYRSNKLMYDHDTKSLWSTLRGTPVVGKLVSDGSTQPIQLEPLQVVTTTWGKWRDTHPNTTVLTRRTGHRRDYSEGAAYRDYFATDRLMFTVPKLDTRLKNKDEVFVVRVGRPAPANEERQAPLAISSKFLMRNPIYYDQVANERFVVLTDSTGANRAYETGTIQFSELIDDGRVRDEKGNIWNVTEDELANPYTEETLSRLPAHRAFWFGWYSAHPDTRLVK